MAEQIDAGNTPIFQVTSGIDQHHFPVIQPLRLCWLAECLHGRMAQHDDVRSIVQFRMRGKRTSP